MLDQDNPIRRSAAPVSDDDLTALEHSLGLELPAEHRAFLLQSNGGFAQRTVFSYTAKGGKSRRATLGAIYPAGREDWAEFDALDIETAYQNRPRGLPSGMLPVADAETDSNTGCICLGCSGSNVGKVFFRPYVDPDKGTLHPVAESWASWLQGMKLDGKPRPWHALIQDGDVAGLRQFLQENRKKWDFGDVHIDMERMTVEENQIEIARLLINEFEFDASSGFEEALRRHRLAMAHALLQDSPIRPDVIRPCLAHDNPFLWHVPQFLDELIAAGADVNEESHDGNTALHYAVQARGEEGVRLLLERGADPTIRNDDNRTPLKLARRLEELRLGEILVQAERDWASRNQSVEPKLQPFDLCGVKFIKTGPPLTIEDIQAFEAEIRMTLPSDYRWLLLQANGASLSPNMLPIDPYLSDDEDEDEDEEDESEEGFQDEGADIRLNLYPLRREDMIAPEDSDDANEDEDENEAEESEEEEDDGLSWSVADAKEWHHDGTELPRGKLPIGGLHGYGYEGAGFLLIGCKGKDRGKLFAFDDHARALDMTLPDLFQMLADAQRRPKTPGERLADAIEARDLNAVKAAAQDGGSKTWMTRDGRIPLRKACEIGFDDAIVAIAEAGGDADQILSEAAQEGRFEAVRRLLTLKNKPTKSGLAETLFVNPALFADVDLVKRFVERGVNFSKLLTRKRLPLPLAAAESGSVEGLKYILDLGGDPKIRDKDRGDTLLHAAARARSGDPAATIRYLLELGVAANQANCDGRSALHEAAIAGNLEAAKVLIDAGENPRAKFYGYPEGTAPEKAEEAARKLRRMAEKSFRGLSGLVADMEAAMDDEDGPPIPDTSEPVGEKLAQMLETMQEKRQAVVSELTGLGSKLMAELDDEWGKAPSVIQMLERRPEKAEFLAQLLAYVDSKP